jgi:hypothetical protein
MSVRPLRTLVVHALDARPLRRTLIPCQILGQHPITQRRQLSSTPHRRAAKPAPTTTATDLPVLPRPLGVQDPPSTASKTWQEKKEELLDRERHLAKRKALLVLLTSPSCGNFVLIVWGKGSRKPRRDISMTFMRSGVKAATAGNHGSRLPS